MRKKFFTALCTLMVVGTVHAVAQRDYISIVGSSTVFPFATVVAERFGKSTSFKTPKIESTGSGGGFKLFCSGLGAEHPDITNASRRIKKSEVESCAKNGVTDIVEVLIGYDGIVLANSKQTDVMKLSLRDIYLALAKDIPDPKGSQKLIPNPNKTWKDVNSTLSAKKIEVLGPPPTSGTRDAFVELAMEGGCSTFDWIKAMEKSDAARYKAACHGIREDGAFIEAGENDNLIVQKLVVNADALGIFGFSFLSQNADVVQGSLVEGHEPTFESIAEGAYLLSRPLYFYVKKAHIDQIPGIRDYVKTFTSEKAWGSEGYLADKGMIPLSTDKRKAIKKSVDSLELLKL